VGKLIGVIVTIVVVLWVANNPALADAKVQGVIAFFSHFTH
jgi:hypothetical protein